MRVTLTVTAGEQRGRVFTFAGHDTFLVGRSRHAHFQLSPKDRFCSRFHFVIEVNPPHCRLMDLGSNNGTFINNQRVQLAELFDGDEIRAGRSVLRLGVGAADEETVDEAAGPSPSLTEPHVPAPWPVLPLTACAGCGSAMLAREKERGEGAPSLCPACLLSATEQPQPVAGYQIVRPLGQGGMGVVYLAVRARDGQPCALKVMLPRTAATPAQVGRFLREAGILRELDHPNIVAFRDVGECGGRLYFVMDYVAGQDLGKLLKAHGPFPIPRAAGWACGLLDALEYAHGRRFVHRDIKPANVMIADPGGAETVRLVDFGLARIYQASQISGLTATGDMGGTPAYTAPEQVLRFREAQPASDLYAVPATLYHLLTDRLIYNFTGEPAERFLKVLNEDPIPIRQRRPDLPEELAQVIHRCLAREPSRRFADAAGLRAALRPFCRGSAG